MENRIKVLIADSSEAFCGHLKNELQQLDGYDLVGTATDGEEAVRLLEQTKPDILVLDLMLAKRDGISVLRYANAMDKPPVGLVTSGFVTDYVAMTVSNLGVQYLICTDIHQDGTIDSDVKEQVTAELKKYFRPEFINRVDDIVVFSPLTEAQISGIIDIAFQGIANRLTDREITMSLTDAAKTYIARASYDPAYGARPVKRYLQKNLETQLAEMLIRGTLSDGQHVTIDSNGEKLTFTVS